MSAQVKQLFDNINRILVSVSACGLVALFVSLSGMKVSQASTEIRVETMDAQVQEIRADLKHQGRQLQEILVAIARLSPAHNTGED